MFFGPSNKIHIVVGDICSHDTRRQVMEEAIRRFGRIEVLVNNAGVYLQNLFENVTEQEYDKTMESNVKQAFFLTQLCIPHLIESQGIIYVNILWMF